MRSFWLVFAIAAIGCKPEPHHADDRSSALPEASSEPPPHYHDYSEIAPDELGTPERDAPDSGIAPAIAAADCPMSEPPPMIAPAKRIQSGPPVTNYVPPEIIMRPIRKRAPCFRGCYQAGLSRNPKLAGRIVIRFVVDLDGWVRRARVVENELGDGDVSECVRRAFVGLEYPRPEGGDVTVVYPVQFSP